MYAMHRALKISKFPIHVNNGLNFGEFYSEKMSQLPPPQIKICKYAHDVSGEFNVRARGPGLSLGPLTFLRGPDRGVFSGHL